MTTCEPAPSGGEDGQPLTLWPEGSPASLSASPGRGSRRRIAGGSGQRSQASFASYDPPSSSWRTSRVSLDGEWETYSETWPASGMTRSGTAYRRPSSVPPIYATGSGLWHTPQTADAWVPTTISENTLRRGEPDGPLRTTCGSLAKQVANPEYWPTPTTKDSVGTRNFREDGTPYDEQARYGPTLTDVVRGYWPTPMAADAERMSETFARGNPTLRGAALMPTPTANRWDGLQSHGVNVVTGLLNPAWVEWLMGYPEGWTGCAG